jgi:predicted nucleic acid-binding protein
MRTVITRTKNIGIHIDNFLKNAVSFIDYDRSDAVEKRAEKIMTYNIKNKDAIHLSCAIEAKSDYFITTDDEVLRKYTGKEIKVCGPIEFINYLEEENA